MHGQRFIAFTLLAICACVAGCTHLPPEVSAYEEAVRDLHAEDGDWQRVRETFQALPDLEARIAAVEALHHRLSGSAGRDSETATAIARELLDLHFGDLQAHETLFRQAVTEGDAETAAFHRDAVEHIRAGIEASGAGTRESPWRLASPRQARQWLRAAALDTVGAAYVADEDRMLFVARIHEGPTQPLADRYFDLSGTFATLRAQDPQPPATLADANLQVIERWALNGDSAAQVTWGMQRWTSGPEHAQRAIEDLQDASANANVLAREALAVIYLALASARSGDEARGLVELAVDQLLLAVAQGSDDAMYNLAQQYLSGFFGEENQSAGIALLNQSAERQNVHAWFLLARLHYVGRFVPEDRDRAVELLLDACEAGDPGARVFYAHHLIREEAFDARAYAWLEDAAEADASPEAMLLLGTLHAHGVHVEPDSDRARDWLRRAAGSTLDAEIINSVAWIFTVAENTDLREHQTGLQLMNALMERDARARENPAYLDTWAAAHAANGEFERAVQIQEIALAIARAEAESGPEPDYLPILETHLELFRNEGTVTEAVP